MNLSTCGGLNGLRAIAALAVVISHISLDLEKFGLDALFKDAGNKPKGILLASYGVSIFFTLSGFLITYLLLKEKEKLSEINIKKFYIRRVLRIWPLYYLYFFVCMGTYFIFRTFIELNIIPFYVFLLANIPIIINVMLPYMGHLWSIGVEEQFYLFWPWMVKNHNRKLLRNAIIFVFLFLMLKVLFFGISYKLGYTIPLIAISVTRFHLMVIGCIAAILFYNNSKLIGYFLNLKTQIASWLILMLAALNIFHISSLVDHEILAVVTVMIILSQITRKNYLIDLDNKVLNLIGKISYGIYVIHPLLIFLLSKLIKFEHSTFLNYGLIYSVIIASTLLVSYTSYNLYEKRFIKLKSTFAIVKSSA